MLTCTQSTHAHKHLTVNRPATSSITQLNNHKSAKKQKTQSHNPVYRLSCRCAGPHSWLNDDNNNNYTHTQCWATAANHRRRHHTQRRQCGWGSQWQHGLLLSKQQKPVQTADSLNTEGQCETTEQRVFTISHSPHSSHASTHTRPLRKAHGRYRERHQTRLHTRTTPRVSALELRGDTTRSKEMRLRVRRGEYLYSIYWIMDDSSLRLLKEGRVGERGWEKWTAYSLTSSSDEAALKVFFQTFNKYALKREVLEISPVWCHEGHWYHSQVSNKTGWLDLSVFVRFRTNKGLNMFFFSGNLWISFLFWMSNSGVVQGIYWNTNYTFSYTTHY